jgi:hypothetical protein
MRGNGKEYRRRGGGKMPVSPRAIEARGFPSTSSGPSASRA